MAKTAFTKSTITTPVSVINGGTGVSTLTAHGVLVGNGTSTVNVTSPGTSGYVLTSNGSGSDPTFQAASGGISSVSGTTNRITSTGGSTPVIDISASYVGQSSITTLGTVTTGTWTGTTIAIANGGTGQTTAANAINALVPSQTGNSGKFLTTDGTVVSWSTVTSGVSSVSNSDGTLTISPTTGSVVASLALGHANTWTGVQTYSSQTNFNNTINQNSAYAKLGNAVPFLAVPLGVDVWGDDNTTGGVQISVGNRNSGTSAYSGYSINNDLAVSADLTHYAFIALNSSTFTDTSFGTAFAVPNQLSIQNTDGPIAYVANKTGNTGAHMWYSGGAGTSNEVMRLTTTGLGIGMTATVPLDVTGNSRISGSFSAALSTTFRFTIGTNGVVTITPSSTGGTGFSFTQAVGGGAGINSARFISSFANSAGNMSGFNISTTWNNASSTSQNTDLLITRVNTAVNAGSTNSFIDAQLSTVSYFRVDAAGPIFATQVGTGVGMTITNRDNSATMTFSSQNNGFQALRGSGTIQVTGATVVQLQGGNWLNTRADSLSPFRVAPADNISTGVGQISYAFRVERIYNQTGAAPGTDFLILRTETALGTGAQYLADFQTTALGSQWNVTNRGVTFQTGKANLAASTTTGSSLNIPSGTAPTSPVSGDLWYDGTNALFRNSSSTQALIQDNGTRLTSGRIPYATTSGFLNDSANLAFTGTVLNLAGDFKLTTAGNGLYVKEGTNATSGLATLAAGTVTVSTTKVTANSRIQLTGQGGSITNLGSYSVTTRTAGTSFVITSSNVLDTNTVAWIIFEPA